MQRFLQIKRLVVQSSVHAVVRSSVHLTSLAGFLCLSSSWWADCCAVFTGDSEWVWYPT